MAKKLTSFDEVLGHKNTINFLQKKIATDTMPDVAIFYGNPGLGKTSLAKLLAIEIATRNGYQQLKPEYTRDIIHNNIDTDAIKLFEMTEIQDKEEEIRKVKAEMNTGFSRTGRKVLILDEAQGMSEKAQSAILVELENLHEGVYVFMCTTDLLILKDTLRSRSKATIHLRDLNERDSKLLVKNALISRNIRFEINQEAAIMAITDWAGNQPREALNLIENFEPNSVVSMSDLSVFVDTTSIAATIELLKYIYGSMTLGIEYVNSMKLDESLVSSVIEVCKVALGHTSKMVVPSDSLYIKEFMVGRDPRNFVKFTAELAGLDDLRRRKVLSVFMRAHVSYVAVVPPAKSTGLDKAGDMRTLEQNVSVQSTINPVLHELQPLSIEAMLAQAEVIEGGV